MPNQDPAALLVNKPADVKLSVEKRVTACMIIVDRYDAHQPVAIHALAGGGGDPKIYFTRPGKVADPTLPREVLWIVNDLRKGEKVVITAKNASDTTFDGHGFEIDPAADACAIGITSGPAKLPVGVKKQLWEYSVDLTHGNGKVPTLDPVIIIEEDP